MDRVHLFVILWQHYFQTCLVSKITSWAKNFFLSRFSFTDTDESHDSRRREGTIFYSTLLLLPAHKHSDIYFATLYMRWISRIFNRTDLFTRLLLSEIYHLIELLFDWLIIWCWFLFVYLLICFEVFVTAIWHWKPVDSNSHRLTFLHYKRTD